LELEEDTNIDGLINPTIKRRRKITNSSSPKTTRMRSSRSSSSRSNRSSSNVRSKSTARRKKR